MSVQSSIMTVWDTVTKCTYRTHVHGHRLVFVTPSLIKKNRDLKATICKRKFTSQAKMHFCDRSETNVTSPKCFTAKDENKIRSSKQTAKAHAAFKMRSLSNKLAIISDNSQGEAKVLTYCVKRVHFSTSSAPERALDHVLSSVVASKRGKRTWRVMSSDIITNTSRIVSIYWSLLKSTESTEVSLQNRHEVVPEVGADWCPNLPQNPHRLQTVFLVIKLDSVGLRSCVWLQSGRVHWEVADPVSDALFPGSSSGAYSDATPPNPGAPDCMANWANKLQSAAVTQGICCRQVASSYILRLIVYH